MVVRIKLVSVVRFRHILIDSVVLRYIPRMKRPTENPKAVKHSKLGLLVVCLSLLVLDLVDLHAAGDVSLDIESVHANFLPAVDARSTARVTQTITVYTVNNTNVSTICLVVLF